jgi:hypothetical protein
MKKLSAEERALLISRYHRELRKHKRLTNEEIQKILKQRKEHAQYSDRYRMLAERSDLKRDLYDETYDKPPQRIEISGGFGIEEPTIADYSLDVASSFMQSNSKELTFDFSNITRVWPSGITLFCSLKKWVEISARHKKKPLLASTSSKHQDVNSYLDHCGFYDFVNRAKDNEPGSYPKEETVKIARENKKANIEKREKQIMKLLEDYSALSKSELQWFDRVILTEVFNNAVEHGKPKGEQGWWILAQRHNTHKFISLCIADNGIGIRNSLVTGPQKKQLEIDNSPLKDGEFIKLALEGNVSGALNASTPKRRKYEAGSRRGHGLKHIRNRCAQLRIPWTILSHNGFVFLDDKGIITKYGAKDNRVFAGTLINIIIRAK